MDDDGSDWSEISHSISRSHILGPFSNDLIGEDRGVKLKKKTLNLLGNLWTIILITG